MHMHLYNNCTQQILLMQRVLCDSQFGTNPPLLCFFKSWLSLFLLFPGQSLCYDILFFPGGLKLLSFVCKYISQNAAGASSTQGPK